MGKRTSYEPGVFCWVDLATSDPVAAGEFYSELFGWDIETRSDGFSMCKLNGDKVAGIYALENEPPGNPPPHWNNLISVRDVDEVVAKTREAGGEVLTEPFDALDDGRMAVLRDPTGAQVVAWQAKNLIGADRVNDRSCFCWSDLLTKEVESAVKFYSTVFGWRTETHEQDGMVYTSVYAGDVQTGGINPMGAQDGVPSSWLPYFHVAYAAASCDKAKNLGATVLVPPMEVPAGTFAVIADPQGATVAFFEGHTDP